MKPPQHLFPQLRHDRPPLTLNRWIHCGGSAVARDLGIPRGESVKQGSPLPVVAILSFYARRAFVGEAEPRLTAESEEAGSHSLEFPSLR